MTSRCPLSSMGSWQVLLKRETVFRIFSHISHGSLDVTAAALLQHTLPSHAAHYLIWKQDGQILLHPRVEFTQYEPLPAMEMMKGVKITCLVSGISWRQDTDTDGNISQHKRELEVSRGRASGDIHLWDSKSQRKRELCPTELCPHVFQNYLSSLFAFSSKPRFEASTCRGDQISAGCHTTAWASFIFSCKQKKWLTHWLMGLREKLAYLGISRPEEFRYLQPNATILHFFNVYMKPGNTDWISTSWIGLLSSLLLLSVK